MRRREFMVGLGAAASSTTWSFAARAQQDGRVRQVGILLRGDPTDGILQGDWLAKLGWIEGRNVRFERRFSADDPDRLRALADELVRLAPDVIVVASLPATRLVLQRTRTIPIVFSNVGDPVAGGLLQDIARPEGNVTGITSVYQSMGGKWLQLLKEAAPRVARVALVFNRDFVSETYFASIDAAAEVLAVNAIRAPYRNAAELERTIDSFAAEPNGGLLMVPPPPSGSTRELINRLAVKYQLPTIYSGRVYAAEDGMMGYGTNLVELLGILASYVDRILRGAKINELPVQFPTKFDLVVNLKTAKAIGLTIPESFLLRADEVIE
jgi:putative tryptophan/tyrosine transport system substrate-binding protein